MALFQLFRVEFLNYYLQQDHYDVLLPCTGALRADREAVLKGRNPRKEGLRHRTNDRQEYPGPEAPPSCAAPYC